MSAVEVDETKVMSQVSGRDWWVDFRRTQHPSRITTVKPGVIGDTVRVACEGDEHARDLAATFMEHAGMPRTAIKVRKGRNG